MTAGWPPLSSVILVPLVSALMCMGPWFSKNRDTNSRLCKVWSVVASTLTLVILLAVATAATVTPGGFLRIEETRRWIPSLGISFHLTLDGLSLVFALLTCVVSLAVILWSAKPSTAGPGWYALLLCGEGAVLGAFLATDLILFYVFYELMLLPVLAAMALWGGPRRLNAALTFLIYTMVGSVLMFVAILYVGWRGFSILGAHSGVTSFAFEISSIASLPRLSIPEQIALGLCFLLAFGIKIPVVPLHGWLAETYRQAPHGTAAFTAALLGKVGIYAIIRFVWPLFPDFMIAAGPFIAAAGAIGVMYGALIALAQRDIRSLLAYSSLSHLGFCVLGLASTSQLAMTGAVFQSISHGVITAALFLLFGAIIDREGADDFESLGGLAKKIPTTAFFLLVFSMAAVALPLTSSFVGEFLVILGAWKVFPEWTLIALTGVVLGAVYTLTAYLKTMFGEVRETLPLRRSDIAGSDAVVVSVMAIVVVALGVFPGKVLSLIEPVVSLQMENLTSSARASMSKRTIESRSVLDARIQPIRFDVVADGQ